MNQLKQEKIKQLDMAILDLEIEFGKTKQLYHESKIEIIQAKIKILEDETI